MVVQILEAYDGPLRKLMEQGGYTTADVINVTSETPGLQGMLDKFCTADLPDAFFLRLEIMRRRQIQHRPAIVVQVKANGESTKRQSPGDAIDVGVLSARRLEEPPPGRRVVKQVTHFH